MDLVFNKLSSTYAASPLGSGTRAIWHYAPLAADLNQDGRPELYIGTETGGIVSYLPGTQAVLATQTSTAAAQALTLRVYPNPAGGTEGSIVETAQPTSLRLFDLTGRLVQQDPTLLHRRRITVAHLVPGFYLVQATAANGTATTQKLLVH
jgi:hypothetical protein